MKFRRIVLIGLFLSMLFVIGCGENQNNKEEYNNSETVSEETTEAAITEEHFHSEYTWKEINKSVNVFEQSMTREQENNTRYGCIRVELAPLFDDDDITRIEYHIDNGNGYFMDKNEFATMSVEQMEKQADTLTKWEENGYHCSLEEQEDIYFTVYFKHGINLERQQQITLKSNLMRKLSIVVDLKYKDGTEKQHRYAFDFPYNYNITNVKIYELTKE